MEIEKLEELWKTETKRNRLG